MTGYQKDLYSLRSFPGDNAHVIETKLFQPIDTGAAEALQLLKDNVPRVDWGPARQDAWATFLTSLHTRMPEDREILRLKWSEKFHDFEEASSQGGNERPRNLSSIGQEQMFDTQVAQIHANLVRSQPMRRMFLALHWACVDFSNFQATIYFSDRPMLRTAPLSSEDGVFLMPIGPKRLFIATSNKLRAEKIVQTANLKDLKLVNRGVVGQAEKYCYAVDDSPLRFISNNFGRFTEPRPMLGVHKLVS